MSSKLLLSRINRLKQSLQISFSKLKSPLVCRTCGISTSEERDSSSQETQVEAQKRRNLEVGQLTELVRDFLDPADFFRAVKTIAGIEFFCGVPDSLLKDFCAYVSSNVSDDKHIITANEGSAVALASGYHLATGKHAMVYLQNSGLGNTVNPLMSLAMPGVYSIPMLLLVGWRGEPGKRDEPQHIIQGQATPGLLAALSIPFQPLPDYIEGAEHVLMTAKQHMENSKGPYALLVKRQTFLPYKLTLKYENGFPFFSFPLNREEAVQIVVDNLHERDVVVGTTGMLSRELFEYRIAKGQGHEKDFLTVGSMGHASIIALGIALQKQNRQVICLDGDGAAIMHLGSMSTIGHKAPPNFIHVIINNGVHDSVGGQPTDAIDHERFNFGAIAKGCGYKETFCAKSEEEIKEGFAKLKGIKGPVLFEIKTRRGARKDLGRPTRTPEENKMDFMHFLAIN